MTDRLLTVRGERELAVRAGHLFAGARTEFACAATDLSTWSGREIGRAIGRAVRERHSAGLRVCKLFRPSALADEESAAHLRAVAGSGVEVRISVPPLPHEIIMIDRRVLILAGEPSTRDRTFTVVQAPEVIRGVAALFWAAWEAATELTNFARDRPPQISEQSREILRRLRAGLKDETAARQLDLPLRTYRRRVAELMSLLGAGSRFQAGVRASELGLLATRPGPNGTPATAGRPD